MAGRVEENPDIVLRLFRGDRGSEGYCLGDRGVQVSDLEVEVHHRALLPVGRWPYRGLVTARLEISFLEDAESMTLMASTSACA